MSGIKEEKIKYLVADTTAFINAVPLNEYAENVLTVPDVVAEVRNKRQIRRLCVLPYDLQVREPRSDSVKYCVEFAKKTGDYASLSGIDIKVIALTYELEVEQHGGKAEHLRKEPVLSKIVASKEKPEELQAHTKMAGWYSPKAGEGDEEDEYQEEDEEDSESDGEEAEQVENGVDAVKAAIEKELYGIESDINPNALSQEDDVSQEELDKILEQLKTTSIEEDDSTCNILVPEERKEEDSDRPNTDDDGESPEAESSNISENNNVNDSEEDNGGWITPSNLKKVKKSLEGKVEEEEFVPLVACMSTDFAIQNVCMQINLHVLGLNGRVIKQLRTYILRCYACFKTTSIITKVFCPNCGHKTLKRVSVSIDENGKQVIHINTRRPLTRKYKNQSLPNFRGGKHSRNPILYEDQPMPRQMASKKAKAKTNALDEDYIAGFSPFVQRDVDSKSAVLRKNGHLKEWARNANYEEDRRKKYYNRLYK